jgi:hypothetical protein
LRREFDVAVDDSSTAPKRTFVRQYVRMLSRRSIHPPIVKSDPLQQTAEDAFDVMGYHGLEKIPRCIRE